MGVRTCSYSYTGPSVATLAISAGVGGTTVVTRETRYAFARFATTATKRSIDLLTSEFMNMRDSTYVHSPPLKQTTKSVQNWY